MRWRLGGIGGVGDGLDGIGFRELLASAVFATSCPLLIDESLCAPFGLFGYSCYVLDVARHQNATILASLVGHFS